MGRLSLRRSDLCVCSPVGLTLPFRLQRVDSEVVMLSAHWEKKQASLRDLQRQLQQLPGLIADLESLTASLSKFPVCL